MVEHELIEPVAMANADGTFNPSSHGWCRRPIVDTSAIGSAALTEYFGRNKRWEYWCILTPSHIVALCIASLDTVAAHEVWILHRRTKEVIAHGAIGFGEDGAANCILPAHVDGNAHARGDGLEIDIENSAKGTRLRAVIPGARVDVLATMPPGHERMGVVVPWSTDLFQYTVKDVCRPAVGTLTVGDEVIEITPGESWAVLDHGRGRWPAEIAWNWGAGCGQTAGGRVIGLQVGGRWTDGTGSTENAVLVGTTLHKISVPLTWEYDTEDYMKTWRVHGGGLDAYLVPFYDKHSEIDAEITASRTDQCFGYWHGTFDTGAEVIKFRGLIGFAEDVERRW